MLLVFRLELKSPENHMIFYNHGLFVYGCKASSLVVNASQTLWYLVLIMGSNPTLGTFNMERHIS